MYLTVLHSGSGINFKLSRIYGTPQAGIISPGIFSICITLGVVNVLGRKVATQSLLGNLKFPRSVTVSQESQSLTKDVRYASFGLEGILTMQILRMV